MFVVKSDKILLRLIEIPFWWLISYTYTARVDENANLFLPEARIFLFQNWHPASHSLL